MIRVEPLGAWSVVLGLRITHPPWISFYIDRVLQQNWHFLALGGPSFPSDLLDFQSLKIPLKGLGSQDKTSSVNKSSNDSGDNETAMATTK